MGKIIKRITPVTVDGESVETHLWKSERAKNYYIACVREAYERGDYDSKPAGPGWGTHNTLLAPTEGAHDIYAPYYGTWLATIEDMDES